MGRNGVKSVRHLAGNTMRKTDSGVLVLAAEEQTFAVTNWTEDVSAADKEKIVWEIIDTQTKEVIKKVHKRGTTVTFSISKKLSGKVYMLRASTSSQDDDYGGYIFVEAYADPLIISSKWSLTEDGANIKNGTPIGYGDNVYLRLETEGLNSRTLTIEVYIVQTGEDKAITPAYSNVLCQDGTVSLVIRNTYAWRAQTRLYTADIEEFYVKVMGSSGYVSDKLGQKLHAVSLRVKDITKSRTTLPHGNLPVKVGESEIKIQRYESCGFSEITVVKDGKHNNITLFNEKSLRLENQTEDNTYVYNEIFYDFDKSEIRPDAKPVLNRIATFLNENPYIPVELGSHTDCRGTDEYNMKLSERRAKSAVDYLISQGVDESRIYSKGYGETQPVIKEADMPENAALAKPLHQLNRRTTLLFKIYENDARSIEYETAAPSSTNKRELPIKISDFKVDECYRSGNNRHVRKVPLTEYTVDPNDTNPHKTLEFDSEEAIRPMIYSNQGNTWTLIPPMQYIWPQGCAPNNFNFRINSCRYYTNKEKTSLIVKAYPDIKWTLSFFLNLKNLLGVSWQNKSPEEHRKLQSEAGKMGAEKRWQQKDASFGFSLKGEWDKPRDKYLLTNEFKLQFEAKFKKLYNLFSSIGDISRTITQVTKGEIRTSPFKNMPFKLEVKPPEISLTGVWFLDRVIKAGKPTNKIGTSVDLKLGANPLIGLELTIDLIAALVSAAAGVATAGSATAGASKIYYLIKDKLNGGIEVGDTKEGSVGVKASADIYLDLVLSSTISTNMEFKFNTRGSSEQTNFKVEASNKIKVEVKAGLWVKGEIALIVVTAEGYFEAKVSGSGSITLGVRLEYDKEGLYFCPQLGFDGIIAEYVVLFKVGISSKKVWVADKTSLKASDNDTYVIVEDSAILVEPFDVIEWAETTFDFKAKVPLMKNN